MHRFGNTIATTHFGHKGSRKTDNKLPALLYSTVHPDPLLTQDLWGDLKRQREKKKRERKKQSIGTFFYNSLIFFLAGCCRMLLLTKQSVLCQQLRSGRFPSPIPHVPTLSIRSANCRSGSPQTNSLNSHLPNDRTLSTTTEHNAGHSAFHPIFSNLALNPLCYCTSVRC